ncbi:hypothetical protein D1819_15255 [Pseudoalteromonas tunicata]|jgi:hypothetical protein|uniref:Uncharacterized protein n=1 Tax=Pseudoalteromonas tunicata D2 TaxID=87626 RepID=A4CFC0_9GAMM|nr:hypothetical protein D1819_15255 [Pseudoalteromonas tunicata]EAR26558.1 hypothetical protein PTD2_09434 [Pseudoalteromonas tunicata D2]
MTILFVRRVIVRDIERVYSVFIAFLIDFGRLFGVSPVLGALVILGVFIFNNKVLTLLQCDM